MGEGLGGAGADSCGLNMNFVIDVLKTALQSWAP